MSTGFSPKSINELSTQIPASSLPVRRYDESGKPVEPEAAATDENEEAEKIITVQQPVSQEPLEDTLEEEEENLDADQGGDVSPKPESEEVELSEEGQNAQAMAEGFVAQGKLPSDFNIDEVDSYEALEAKYADYVAEKVQKEARAEVYRQIAEEEGVTEETIELAKRLSPGTNIVPKDVQYLQALQTYAQQDVATLDEEGQKTYLMESFMVTGTPQADALVLAEVWMDKPENERAAKLIAQNQMFSNAARSENERQQNEQLRAENERRQQRKVLVEGIKDVLDKGQLVTQAIDKATSSKIKNAIFSATEVVKTPDGKQRTLTLWDSIINELPSNPALLAELVKAALVAKGKIEEAGAPAPVVPISQRKRSYNTNKKQTDSSGKYAHRGRRIL